MYRARAPSLSAQACHFTAGHLAWCGPDRNWNHRRSTGWYPRRWKADDGPLGDPAHFHPWQRYREGDGRLSSSGCSTNVPGQQYGTAVASRAPACSCRTRTVLTPRGCCQVSYHLAFCQPSGHICHLMTLDEWLANFAPVVCRTICWELALYTTERVVLTADLCIGTWLQSVQWNNSQGYDRRAQIWHWH